VPEGLKGLWDDPEKSSSECHVACCGHYGWCDEEADDLDNEAAFAVEILHGYGTAYITDKFHWGQELLADIQMAEDTVRDVHMSPNSIGHQNQAR
jgi:hypothetical protein